MFLYSGGCPPGLSIAGANRVAGKHQLKSDMLLMRKVSLSLGEYYSIVKIRWIVIFVISLSYIICGRWIT
jgi:hypothetical protein